MIGTVLLRLDHLRGVEHEFGATVAVGVHMDLIARLPVATSEPLENQPAA